MNFPWFQDTKKAGKLTLLLFLTGLILATVSCVTNKQAVYVQPGKENKVDFNAIQKKPRTIQPGDELYINISSDDLTTNIFRTQFSNSYLSRDVITLISFDVNEEGYIRLGTIGNIYLKGLTLDEASKVVEKTLNGIISNPMVSIKFVNKTITVLGAVERPGKYEYYDHRINIFQALGFAGDISQYGNRKKVMLVREKNNVITRNYIDLTNENLLGSSGYYIKSGDVIYVEPLKRRHWDMDTFPFTLVLSAASTVILVLSYLHLYK